ncbi:alpha-L-rhamnosidase N-terminal domain-containing protein [candidate division KSB1 bacterium]|nr:alpha-L-rhamnosidase N-terminal domain-containing protein [candidate division KSB1 bacterium]
MLKAKWIWRKQASYKTYNQIIIARKVIDLKAVKQATLKITVDSFYRLYINGDWVNDGPCRSWHTHYQYDELDVTSYLKKGENEISVLGWYWGCGTFHNIAQQAGLLAQLDVTFTDGSTKTLITDKSWEVAAAPAWLRNTRKVSIQMEPQEIYDARLEDSLQFEPATVLFDAHAGSWKDLNPRDTALLTRKPLSFRAIREINSVRKQTDLDFCLPAARLLHPDLVEANHNTSMTCGMCTVLNLAQKTSVAFFTEEFRISVDGVHQPDGTYKLQAGQHIILAFVSEHFGHRKEKSLRILQPPDSLKLINPLDPAYENPWCLITFPEFTYAGDDLNWRERGAGKEKQQITENYEATTQELSREITDVATFRQLLGDKAQCLPTNEMFVRDTHWKFIHRNVIGDARDKVENPAALMFDNAEITTINPPNSGDMELAYDIGEQSCGYYEFELIADEGVELDIYGVEYISDNGKIQHSHDNRNGVSYITKAGVNSFTSLKRRSGRYLYLTLRNQHSPVCIRLLRLIEATYPVNQIGSFQCSDPRMDKIWEISARTLKLCMEDTFTDCPLYEQTLWVGDARNEAFFAYTTFGATDIARRCIRLAAESLERFPIIGCQVPSAWDCLLPAWSFLWGISVWDYYAYSGDEAFLRETWDSVILNLKGSEKFLNEQDLFSAPMWNMFDWSGIDDGHETVLHNSMLIVGAIDAAIKCAQILKDKSQIIWLKSYRIKLCTAINKLWDSERNAYPDSIHEDGSISQSISQHTSFLSILFDIVEKHNAAAALKNLIDPPKDMVGVGSPFVMLYYFQALEKAGKPDEIIKSILESYQPMLEADATTVWENFPGSTFRSGEFPTRSHCHAWSSSPLHFLNRIILGIRQTKPGGIAFEVSPRLNGLSRAKGAISTINGPLTVSWRVENKVLRLSITAPPDVQVDYKENETHSGLEIEFVVDYAPYKQ